MSPCSHSECFSLYSEIAPVLWYILNSLLLWHVLRGSLLNYPWNKSHTGEVYIKWGDLNLRESAADIKNVVKLRQDLCCLGEQHAPKPA